MTEEEYNKLDGMERIWMAMTSHCCDNCRYTYWLNEQVETCLHGMKAGNLCDYKVFELMGCPGWKKDPVEENDLERMVKKGGYTYPGITDKDGLCEMLRSKIHLDMKLLEDINGNDED